MNQQANPQNAYQAQQQRVRRPQAQVKAQDAAQKQEAIRPETPKQEALKQEVPKQDDRLNLGKTHVPLLLRAKNFLRLINDLNRILQEENAVLKKPQAETLMPLVQEKEVMMRLYEEEVDALAAEAPFMARLPEDLQQQLKEAARKFDALIAQNDHELRLNLTVSQTIMKNICEAAQKVKNKVSLYGKSGQASHAGAMSAPVALNRKL